MNKLLIVLLFGLQGTAALAQKLPPTAPTMPTAPNLPGLYVSVIDGLINVSNKGGSQNFTAGQFGYTANPTQPPVVVPKNPGILFTPPPAFNAPPTTTASSGTKSNAVECEVR